MQVLDRTDQLELMINGILDIWESEYFMDY